MAVHVQVNRENITLDDVQEWFPYVPAPCALLEGLNDESWMLYQLVALPFCSGRHNGSTMLHCVLTPCSHKPSAGDQFALSEAVVALAMLMRRFEFSMDPEAPPVTMTTVD